MCPSISPDKDAIVSHALAYPFARPFGDFVLGGNKGVSFNENLLEGRTAVLACGSNQSVDQLKRKFGHALIDDCLPVSQGRLFGYDVVYSANFSRYGAIPATLWPSPGTDVGVSITWLSVAQLKRMHETEALGKNYAFCQLDNGRYRSATEGAVPRSLFAYAGLWGILDVGEGPIALAAIDADNRQFRAADQETVQRRVLQSFGFAGELGDFVFDTVQDHLLRTKRTLALPRQSLKQLPSGFFDRTEENR